MSRLKVNDGREQPAYSRASDCQLLHLFPRVDGCIVIPNQNPLHLPLFGGRCRLAADDPHHVVGQTPRGRTDDPRNVLYVSRTVHDWLTDHTCASRIICCKALKELGRLDWRFLSDLDRKRWPGIFETDPYIAATLRFPWVEPYRAELIRKAA